MGRGMAVAYPVACGFAGTGLGSAKGCEGSEGGEKREGGDC